ncbi:MAG TPA: hypothetical protein VFK40_11895, partial [Nitrososphaeraceae archaeon]|nr:hypothetical protein [Nitrososphaeraceae archaeon]
MLKFLTLLFLLISIVSISTLFFNPSDIIGELENKSSSMSSSLSSSNQVTPTHSKILPTYLIEITTGSGVSYKFQHFYPLKIAIPLDTTVAWYNSDPEQIHTVTSG